MRKAAAAALGLVALAVAVLMVVVVVVVVVVDPLESRPRVSNPRMLGVVDGCCAHHLLVDRSDGPHLRDCHTRLSRVLAVVDAKGRLDMTSEAVVAARTALLFVEEVGRQVAEMVGTWMMKVAAVGIGRVAEPRLTAVVFDRMVRRSEEAEKPSDREDEIVGAAGVGEVDIERPLDHWLAADLAAG